MRRQARRLRLWFKAFITLFLPMFRGSSAPWPAQAPLQKNEAGPAELANSQPVLTNATPVAPTMATTAQLPSSKTVICVGMVGSFLTAVAGITGSMLSAGWAASGGWSEWGSRLLVGYPCACLVVVTLFPFMVPRLTQRLEAHWAKPD